MTDLERYIEELFSSYEDTPEIVDLKEEILSNMLAKIEDLKARGMSEDQAIEEAKTSLPSIDDLVDSGKKSPAEPKGLSTGLKALIGALAALAIVFCVVEFAVLPSGQAKQNESALKQTDSLTHDISSIKDYKSPYIGDASNVSHLFYALPLSNISMKFQIDPNSCSLTVNYLDTVWNIGEEKVHRDLIYNSLAAMASIDNLTKITYEFSGDNFSFERKQLEDKFGAPLSNLLDKEKWTEVQKKLSSDTYCNQFYQN